MGRLHRIGEYWRKFKEWYQRGNGEPPGGKINMGPSSSDS